MTVQPGIETRSQGALDILWRLGRNRGARYLLRRLGQGIVVLGIIVALQFFLLHLTPGDLADVLASEAQNDDPELVAKLRRELGLDQPIVIQFGYHAWRLATLDLGFSHSFGQRVIDLIMQRLPATLILMLPAIVLAFVLGCGAGIIAALRVNRLTDVAISVFAMLFYATPAFLVGLMLIIVFTVKLQWFPLAGMVTPGAQHNAFTLILDICWHLVLPATALALFFLAIYTRLMRATMLEILGLDYMRTARAKGLSRWRIIWRHGARNALLPMVTVLGLQLGSMFGGVLLIETVFGWPGLGRLAFEGVFRRDVPLVMGILFLSSVLVLVINLAVDLIYARIDPRIQLR